MAKHKKRAKRKTKNSSRSQPLPSTAVKRHVWVLILMALLCAAIVGFFWLKSLPGPEEKPQKTQLPTDSVPGPGISVLTQEEKIAALKTEELQLTEQLLREFPENDVTLAFGSDWDVAPLDAILGIYAAVTRRTLDGANPDGWIPEQKITVEQAIKGYTIAPAFASFQESIKGSITPGKLADMVVLSQDILTIPAEQIENTEVLFTIVNGRVVFRKK